jgi:hypothetical protein
MLMKPKKKFWMIHLRFLITIKEMLTMKISLNEENPKWNMNAKLQQLKKNTQVHLMLVFQD